MKKTIKKKVKLKQGTSSTPHFVEEKVCVDCKGTGRFPHSEITCARCNGTGK